MNNQLIMEMTRYYSGDPKHIQHFMKVYAYARMIGEMEGLDRKTQHMLETAAIVHDIGIKESMETALGFIRSRKALRWRKICWSDWAMKGILSKGSAIW